MSALVPFEPSRADGRSDADIVFSVVSGADPDTVFRYEDLIVALSEGADDREITVEDARAAVYPAAKRLLVKEQRTLVNVRGVGYRVASANEHRKLARNREGSARRQLKRGVKLMKQVRLGEMSEGDRQAHIAYGNVLMGVAQALDVHDARISDAESELDALRQRVGRLEEGESQ